MKDAMCFLVLDDWFDDLKAKGSKAWSTAKQFVLDNKSFVYPLLQNIIRSVNPLAGKVFDGALSAFGGKILSEEPYAMDEKYIKYIFGLGPAAPLGRFENHYMYQMTTRIEVPVSTLADGTALVTIIPDYCVNSSFLIDSYYLPSVSVAAGSTTNPFAATPTYNGIGPFFAQQANMSTYAIDSVQIDFI